MYDPTPAPFGDITRRWTLLAEPERDEHVSRLLGVCPGDRSAHVDRPKLDEGVCYRRLIPAAVAGDPVAVGWLATTHRPLLVARGRALFEHDPTEWGAASLAALHTTLATLDPTLGRWTRRRVAHQLATRISAVVHRHLANRSREHPTSPIDLRATVAPNVANGWDPHPDLTVALDRALARLDAPTRDALVALANDEPLAAIAVQHGLSHAAVKQRVVRARTRLQPQLAEFRRAAA